MQRNNFVFFHLKLEGILVYMSIKFKNNKSITQFLNKKENEIII